MATLNRHNPFFFGNSLNQSPIFVGGEEYPHSKETASQSYIAGGLVYLDSNGTVATCTLSTDRLNSKILGTAVKAATGVTGDDVLIRVIRPSDIYVMQVHHGTAASAVTAQTQLGAIFGVDRQTVSGNGTSIWCVNIEDAVTGSDADLARVRCVGFPLKNPFDAGNLTRPAIGDVYGLMLVQFITSNSHTDGTDSAHNLLQWS